MNARTPKASYPAAARSTATLLIELDMPRSLAFKAFEDELVARLAELEERFSDFVTRDSFAGSIRGSRHDAGTSN